MKPYKVQRGTGRRWGGDGVREPIYLADVHRWTTSDHDVEADIEVDVGTAIRVRPAEDDE